MSHYALLGSAQISDEGVSRWIPSKTEDRAVGKFCWLDYSKMTVFVPRCRCFNLACKDIVAPNEENVFLVCIVSPESPLGSNRYV